MAPTPDQHGSNMDPCWIHVGSNMGPCWTHVGSNMGAKGTIVARGPQGTIVAVVSDQVERCHQSKREIPNVMCKHYVKVGPSSTSVPWPQGNAQKSLSENALWPGTPTKPKMELFQRTLPLKMTFKKLEKYKKDPQKNSVHFHCWIASRSFFSDQFRIFSILSKMAKLLEKCPKT